MPEMPALTIWQPWASLIMAGVKPYEFRQWKAPRGSRRIAIHAGARKVRREEIAGILLVLRLPARWTQGLLPGAEALLERWHAAPGSLPLGAVLGTAFLSSAEPATRVMHRFGGPPAEDLLGQGWAWPLSDVRPWPAPVPAKGAQGLWLWSGAVVA